MSDSLTMIFEGHSGGGFCVAVDRDYVSNEMALYEFGKESPD